MESVGFIGAGQMAKALSGGILRAGLVKPVNIIVSDAYVIVAPHSTRSGFPNNFNTLQHRVFGPPCPMLTLSSQLDVCPRHTHRLDMRQSSFSL